MKEANKRCVMQEFTTVGNQGPSPLGTSGRQCRTGLNNIPKNDAEIGYYLPTHIWLWLNAVSRPLLVCPCVQG